MAAEDAPARETRLRRKLAELCGIDVRSLVLFRVGLGTMLLADLVKRSLAFREHYTGEGMFPREAAETLRPDLWVFRLYMLSDEPWVQAILFGLGATLALMVVAGYRTRLATLLCVLHWAALVRRNPYATHTGDVWLQALTFWALFLPLGSAGSVDRRLGRVAGPGGRQVVSLGTAAILLQIVLFYVSAGALKHRHELWQRGEALSVFAGIAEYTRPFALWLGSHPELCRFLTYGTLVLEGLCPLLFFVPFQTARVRTALVFAFAAFHAGIQLTVYIGLFELVSILGVCLFLPGAFWDRLGSPARIRRLAERLRPSGEPRREPARARPRSRWGERIGQAVAAGSIALVLASNVNSAIANVLPIPGPVDAAARPLGLVQNWNIFTDIDELFVGWFASLGQTRTGRIVDVLSGEDFRGFERPELVASFFPNHNARRFWTQAAMPQNEWLRGYVLRFLGRRWNAEHGDRIEHLALFHVGRVPGRGETKDRVVRLGVMEFPREGAGGGPAEAAGSASRNKQAWRGFLAGLPETVRTSDARAIAVAERSLERLGGRDAWERTRHLHWRFHGREHWWDKPTGNVRIRTDEVLVLMNVGTRLGRVFRDGDEVLDPDERGQLLEQGHAWWVNDSYWLVMPYKMLDPGVVLAYVGAGELDDGRAADVLGMTFQGVGLTPRNRYVVLVARDSGLVEEWRYFERAGDKRPAFALPWRGWRRFGRILLATDRGTDEDWDLRVEDEMPASLYDSP